MRKVKQREKPPPLRVPRVPRQESKNDTKKSVMMAHMQYKQPLIIHTFSPEVIQTNSHDFMNLVQRLTGRVAHVSPPLKRPRYSPRILHTSPHMHHTSDSSEVQRASLHTLHASDLRYSPIATFRNEQQPVSLQRSPLKLQQEEENCISELASRRGLSPRVRLGIKLQPASSPHSRLRAGMQGAGLMRSPTGFEFSPSTLPTPSAFLQDYPSLSPYVNAAGLISPMLGRAGSVARSPMVMPSMLPSPGPLTSAFLADLPILSPAAQSWIEKHPLSAELVLSPLSKGFGLPPPGQRKFLA